MENKTECGTCPVYEKMNFRAAYYCARGLEEEQKSRHSQILVMENTYVTHQLSSNKL